MKVQCIKNNSTVTNFIDGKLYECFHEADATYLRVRWIKDELNHWRCIIPNDPACPHLFTTGPELDFFGYPNQKASGMFKLIDDEHSKLFPNDPIW